MRIPFTNEVTFQDYVYQDFEVYASDIASSLLYINPEYTGGNKYAIRYSAFKYIARHAHQYITCYRALEWWSAQPDYFMIPRLKRYARFVLSVIQKPTKYLSMSSFMQEATD